MATWWDDNGFGPNQDPYDPNGNPPGWVPPAAGGGPPTGGGAAPPPSSISLYDAVAQIYRTALGREGSAEDINAWIQGTGGNLAQIQQGIYASPEAAEASKRQQATGAASTTSTSTGPQDGNWEAWFRSLTNGKPPTPAQLIALEGQITAAGGKVLRNAKGVAGKIQLPGGQIVDVLQGADGGGVAWQWLTGDGGGGGGATTGSLGFDAANFGGAPDPYSSDPNAPQYTALPEYHPLQWTGGDYAPPTEADLESSPGYTSRLSRLIKGAGRQYAAQGTILNGNTIDALDRRAQDYASGEYQNLRANTLEAYKQRYSQFADTAGRDLASRTLADNENQQTFQNRTNTYLSNNSRTLSDYLTNLTAKRNSELDYWARLNDLNGTGASLAGGSR